MSGNQRIQRKGEFELKLEQILGSVTNGEITGTKVGFIIPFDSVFEAYDNETCNPSTLENVTHWSNLLTANEKLSLKYGCPTAFLKARGDIIACGEFCAAREDCTNSSGTFCDSVVCPKPREAVAAQLAKPMLV